MVGGRGKDGGRNDSRRAFIGKLHRISHSETRVYAPPPRLQPPVSKEASRLCILANYLVHFSLPVQSRRPSCLHFSLILRNVRTGVYKGPRPSQRLSPNQARHDKIASTRCVGVATNPCPRPTACRPMDRRRLHVPSTQCERGRRTNDHVPSCTVGRVDLWRTKDTFLDERRSAPESLSMHPGRRAALGTGDRPPARGVGIDEGQAGHRPRTGAPLQSRARRQRVRRRPRGLGLGPLRRLRGCGRNVNGRMVGADAPASGGRAGALAAGTRQATTPIVRCRSARPQIPPRPRGAQLPCGYRYPPGVAHHYCEPSAASASSVRRASASYAPERRASHKFIRNQDDAAVLRRGAAHPHRLGVCGGRPAPTCDVHIAPA